MSYVFYDTETSGTETSFDQILQFAAIRTDHDFNELDRFEVRCRLLDRVVVAPGAFRVTGVSVAQLTDKALPSHFEMICSIREKLTSWSPAVFVGYNSIKFDEHLVRSALWKSLHRPYLTNSAGNARADAMRIVQAVAAMRQEILQVPIGLKGKPSFKLEDVAPANGFDHSNAHDALADVEATIHLCRVVAERAPDLWSSSMRFTQKAAVLDFVSEEKVFGLIEYYFGREYVFALTNIGRSTTNGSELYAFDVTVDPSELSSLSDGELAVRMTKSPKPVRRVKANEAPFLLSFDDVPGIFENVKVSREEMERRADSVSLGSPLAKRICSALEASKEAKEPSTYVEGTIYDGFASDSDMALCDLFHSSAWEERIALVSRFEDARLRELGRRLVFDERPDLMSPEDREAERRMIADRLLSLEADLPWCTLPRAITECRELLAKASGTEADRLREYLAHCEARHASLQAMV